MGLGVRGSRGLRGWGGLGVWECIGFWGVGLRVEVVRSSGKVPKIR